MGKILKHPGKIKICNGWCEHGVEIVVCGRVIRKLMKSRFWTGQG